VSSTIDATVPEVWAAEVEDYIKQERWAMRFVVEKTDLVRNAGDKVHIPRRAKLTATGDLTETIVLEGNEEKLGLSTVDFTPTERGNAVRASKQATAKARVDLRNEARYCLGDWAADKEDSIVLDAMDFGQTGSRIEYGGDATSLQTIDSADTLQPADLSRLKGRMKNVGVPPFKNLGREGQPTIPMYVGIVSESQLYDLCQHSTYTSAANQATRAQIGQVVGPMFQGFDGYWDGILLYSTGKVRTTASGEYNVTIHKGHVFGPRAMGYARGLFKRGPGFMWNEKEFDYGRAWGIAVTWFADCGVLNEDQLYGIYTAGTDLTNPST